MKRLLSMILALVMVLGMLPGEARAAETSGSCGDNVTWNFADGTLTISGTGAMADYDNTAGVIPWYDHRSNITKIAINGVTKIGKHAFFGCAKVTSVTIPATVTSIGDYAFQGCSNLTSVAIPDTVTSIGISAFEKCTSLILVTIPDSVTSIGDSAFKDCTGLTSMSISDKVTDIGNYAFQGCIGLTSVFIPDSVNKIGYHAFNGCTSLTSIAIFSNNMTEISQYFLANCTNLTSVTIPKSVTQIGAYAFENCGKLSDIYYAGTNEDWKKIAGAPSATSTLTIHYETLGAGACGDNLTWVLGTDGTLTISGSGAMKDYSPSAGTDIPESERAPWHIYRDRITAVKFDGAITHIGVRAFGWCPKIPQITIPDSVTSIGRGAFCGCTGMTNIAIPSGVTAIEADTFEDCTKLTSVTVPEGVTSIGNNAFCRCTGLTEIAIPKTVKTIGLESFQGCQNLETVTYPGTEADWAKIAVGTDNEPLLNALPWSTAPDLSPISGTCTAAPVPAGEKNPTVTFQCAGGGVLPDDLAGVINGGTGTWLFQSGNTTGLSPDTAQKPELVVDESGNVGFTIGFTGTALAGGSGTLEVPAGTNVYTFQVTVADAAEPDQPVDPDDPNPDNPDPDNPTPDDPNPDAPDPDNPDPDNPTPDDPNPDNPDPDNPDTPTPDDPAPPSGEVLSGKCGDNLNWALDLGTGILSITGTGAMYDYDNSDKTSRSATLPPWFAGEHYKDVKAVRLPRGLTSIGDFAFSFCEMTELTVPSGVTAIGEQALYGCGALRQITLPATVTSIGYRAVRKCGALTDVYFGGTRARWNAVAVGEGSDSLARAVIHCLDDGMTMPDYGYTPDYPDTPAPPSKTEEPKKTEPEKKEPGKKPEQEKTPGRPELTPEALIQGILSPIQEIVREPSGSGEAYVDWVDRIETPQYAADLYDVLVAGADGGSGTDAGTSESPAAAITDFLIQDDCFRVDPKAKPAGSVRHEVEQVEEASFSLASLYSDGSAALGSGAFTDDSFSTLNVAAGDRAVDYASLRLGDLVQTPNFNGIFVTSIPRDGNYDSVKKETSSYVSAVFQAFDRDHPEIFWLSGRCKVRISSVKNASGGMTAYFFLVLADDKGFTMRAPDWTAPGAVAQGIARRDTAVNNILTQVTGSAAYEQLRQLNRILTETNEYNTSYDLNAIGNEPHECLRALEGGVGAGGPVCDGYSRAFKVLCDRLGIPCVLENGYARTSPASGSTFHMWNSVQLEGNWYGVDVTWDDPVVQGVSGAKSGHESEEYLLVGYDTEIRGLTFSASHPAVNQAAAGGVAFNNGPALSAVAFSSVTAYAPMAASGLPFRDVPADSPYYEAVRYVYDSKLMIGDSGSTFRPEGTMSRAMLVTMLYRLEGAPAVDTAAGFADVPDGQWYSDAVAWASAGGIVRGYNADTFAPNDDVTREQVVTLLYRRALGQGLAGDVSDDLSAYPDGGAVSGYAVQAVAWAADAGVLPVSGGQLRASAPAGRGEVALMLLNCRRNVEKAAG